MPKRASFPKRFGKFSLIGPLAGALILFWVLVPFGLQGALASANPENRSGWFVDMNRYSRGAHAGLRCEDCHGEMTGGGKKHPEPARLPEQATSLYDYSRCRSCHPKAWERYLFGGHAVAMRKQANAPSAPEASPADPKKEAPTCGHCHSSHYDRSGLSRLETGKRMVDVCGSCHPAYAQSYLEDRHGKVGVHLSGANAAYCSDCHGAHTVVSLREKEDALSACRRCHPEAEAAFTGFVVHESLKAVSQKEGPEGEARTKTLLLLHRIKVIAATAVGLVVAFFFAHSFLWILRELHEKLRKR